MIETVIIKHLLTSVEWPCIEPCVRTWFMLWLELSCCGYAPVHLVMMIVECIYVGGLTGQYFCFVHDGRMNVKIMESLAGRGICSSMWDPHHDGGQVYLTFTEF